MHDGESHQNHFGIEPFLCRRTENIFRLLFHIFEVDSIYSRFIQYIRAFIVIYNFPNLILWSVFQNSVSVLEKLR